jgi:NADH-quinone oxidoreductase subunit J
LTSKTDDVHNIGALLFTNFNLPFQIIGVLVLVATIGVVVLSKRELR